MDRVAAALVNPRPSQAELMSAIGPVADRLLKRYAAAKSAWATALERGDDGAAKPAKDEMEALVLFKGRHGHTFVHVYTFLSQIFDYGNTEIEKRFLFYKALVRLLEFGRERETIDLSQLALTHPYPKEPRQAALRVGRRSREDRAGGRGRVGRCPGQGQGPARRDHRARVNDLFVGDLTDGDQLVYVNDVIKGKMLESDVLISQASNNTKAQFAASPTLDDALLDAIMDALDAHQTMSRQALDSATVRQGLKSVLLGPAQLYEALRNRAETRA